MESVLSRYHTHASSTHKAGVMAGELARDHTHTSFYIPPAMLMVMACQLPVPLWIPTLSSKLEQA